MRIVLCESGLWGVMGHQFNLAAGLKEELAARGVELAIWAHVDLDEELRRAIDAQPVFEHTPHHDRYARGRLHILWLWLDAARRFRAALAHAQPRPDDVLFVSSARPADMFGLAAWLLGRRARPRAVCLNFMVDDFAPSTRAPSTRALLPFVYRASLAALRRCLPRERILLTAGSSGMARQMSEALRAEVAVFPMLKVYPDPPRREPGPPWTLGFLGSPRKAKGRHHLLLTVERCAEALPECRVVVQLDRRYRKKFAGRSARNVEVVDAGLERQRYFELVSRIDLFVLPYDAPSFERKTSGVFAEAVASGAVSVVPSRTWMAEMLQSGRGAGVIFPDDAGSRAIAAAVRDAVDRLDQLRPLALAAREPWRASQSIGAYVDRLLAAVGGLGS